MSTLYIDNVPYEFQEGQNLLHTCLSLGFSIPYFCWHPAMHAVGACRQCAVKQFTDEHDTRGKIVMSCMIPAKDGTRISIDDPEARHFRASIIEFLMANHPHDCPVCDEGGECHLQDMTVLTGHVYRRHRFKKRTFRNQDLGPFINHEMNRCIACYRCVRFYANFAGGKDLQALSWHDTVYFGRHQDGPLQNEFSGNLIEVCPTGVFTDKTFKSHYARKWDLQTAPSVCVHCSLGCNTIPGERYGILRRIRNRYNGTVNGFFLCDRGRFGYDFVNSDQRIRIAEARADRHQPPMAIETDAVLSRIAGIVTNARRVIGIGSPRASVEANFALRTMVGADHFFQGISSRDHALVGMMVDFMRSAPALIATLRDAASADAVLILGEDIINTAPMLGFAVRQSLRRKFADTAQKLGVPLWDDAAVRTAAGNQRSPLFIAAAGPTRLDDEAAGVYRAPPDEVARFGFAVAHAINELAPAPADLAPQVRKIAQVVADALRASKRPLIVSGAGCGHGATIHAAISAALALSKTGDRARLSLTLPECNSFGLACMGGKDAAVALPMINKENADVVIILENDLYRYLDHATVESIIENAETLIAIDSIRTTTAEKVDILLPAASFAEATGTMINNEGRAQRFFKVFTAADHIQESWRWIRDCMRVSGTSAASRWERVDDVIAALVQEMPEFAAVRDCAPGADFRMVDQKIPRQPFRWSGRTAIHASVNVSEPSTLRDGDSPLSFSMEGFPNHPPSPLIPRYWVPGWNSVQSVLSYQAEIAGLLSGGDPGVRMTGPALPEAIGHRAEPPLPYVPSELELLTVPLYHLFGSEELSARAPAVARCVPAPYVALNPVDAGRIGLSEGDVAEIAGCQGFCRFPVTYLESLPPGIAGLPAGFPGLSYFALPQLLWIRKGNFDE
jgi:NADH-quinone oxidoreductase subunit G